MKSFLRIEISHFITRLPAPIELKGEWEVSLVEFIYQHTWFNVNDNTNLIGFELNGEKITGMRIPPGFYESGTNILKAIAIQDIVNSITKSE